mmetsp:Transcript_19722/g.38579  ORF Transcript_19722/g.38579 Transcript_19722/m.38579 type:complete len:354 (-) Transcript_19722:1537-2598(-)|eukprot:CAMPEP_0171486866 /NCGR_PEP_ID=MMETSP0958-20121227/1322_1 /TAXON_ID=87120 /ORGANISM="Aurantiochytrium limacinum, Strain ATCCMYA-1381" /LENGTH=353 /DNA_ID=CAMNT_0012019781 /DNA_START=244 /DNA_END=1305 /DNA_ORIENTATION=-
MDDAEKKRREVQRQTREYVLKLRADGTDPKAIKRLTREFKHKQNKRKAPDDVEGETSRERKSRKWREKVFGERPKGAPSQFGNDRRNNFNNMQNKPWMSEDDAKNQKREDAARKHDVVIIPIFWKRNEEEAEMVKESAQKLKDLLMKHRINAWIDQRSSLLPGQKYEYWESMGVDLRMELGPSEARSQTICLSKARSADRSQLAQRWKDMPTNSPEALHKIFDILRENGLKWLKQYKHEGCHSCEELERERGFDPADGSGAPVPRRSEPITRERRTLPKEPLGQHKKFDDGDEDEDSDNEKSKPKRAKSSHNQEAEDKGDQDMESKKSKKTPSKSKKPKHASGDSLEGNYALD